MLDRPYQTATGSCISIASGRPKLTCNPRTRINIVDINVFIGPGGSESEALEAEDDDVDEEAGGLPIDEWIRSEKGIVCGVVMSSGAIMSVNSSFLHASSIIDAA